MLDFLNKNSKAILSLCAVVVTIVFVTNEFSYAATTNSGEIYTRDELSELTHEINNELITEKGRVNSLISAMGDNDHSEDVYNVDISDALNSEVVTGLREYIKYSKIGKMVILDIGGVIFSEVGYGLHFLTVPESIKPISRTISVVNYDGISDNTIYYGAMIYNAVGSRNIYVHNPMITNGYYGQMVWMTS